jgi:O-antigen ligase
MNTVSIEEGVGGRSGAMATRRTTSIGAPRATDSQARAPNRSSVLLCCYFALIIAGYPLVSAMALALQADTRSFSIAYRMLVLALLMVMVLRWVMLRTKLVSMDTVAAIFALWILLIVRAAWDRWVAVSSPPFGDRGWDEFMVLMVGAGFLPALAFLERPTPATLNRAQSLIQIIGGIALALIAVVGLDAVLLARIDRLSTETLNPISLGHLALSVLIVSMTGSAATERMTFSVGVAWVLRTGIALCAAVLLVASASRGPIIAALVVLLLAAFAPGTRGTMRYGALGRAAMVFAIVAVGVAAMFWLEDNTALRPLERLENWSDASTNERVAVSQGAFLQFWSSPIIGSALYELETGIYPHNIIVESLMAGGVIGFALLVFVIVKCSRTALHLLSIPQGASWLGLLYFQYLVGAMFSGSMFSEMHLWALSIAVLAAVCPVRPNGVRTDEQG